MKLSQFKIDEFIKSTMIDKYHEFLSKTFKPNSYEKRYFEMSLIRSFENKLLECFSK